MIPIQQYMTPDQFLIMAAGIFGLIFGSFANVCIHRLPIAESVVSPRSRCPQCRNLIAWYDNIPILSWLWLKACCRHCGLSISWRYPLIELLMALSWMGLAWHYSLNPMLLISIVLVSILWVLTMIDLDTGLLPDVLTLPGIIIGLGFQWWQGDILSSVIGAVAGYAIFWIINWIFWRVTGVQGMGHGDFKLLAMLGAFLGWQALPMVIFMSSVSGALIGAVYLLISGKGKRAQIPFGPFLALAAMIWLLTGNDALRLLVKYVQLPI
ncbi:MAG: prepilin peptidase [Mariprofundales bacterium]